MRWHIRPITPLDALALQQDCLSKHSIISIQNKLYHLTLFQENDYGIGLVVEQETRIIGFGQMMLWRGCGEIADLFVSKAWRSKGIGTALIHTLIGYAQQKQWHYAELGVAQSNLRAYQLYERLGFLPSYEREHEDGRKVIYLRKPII